MSKIRSSNKKLKILIKLPTILLIQSYKKATEVIFFCQIQKNSLVTEIKKIKINFMDKLNLKTQIFMRNPFT